MSALTVSSLNAPTHHGGRARVTLSRNDTREGVLNFGANPSYPRHCVRHWWLIIPSACRHFTSDALSLQWAGSCAVTILEERSA